MKTLVTWALVCSMGALGGYVVGNNYARTTITKQVVYDTCNQARMSLEITEHQCADLQAKYRIEFLCQENNRLPSNTCWTEAH